MPPRDKLVLEERLATAHRILWTALRLAQDQGLYGMGDDLMMIAAEVARLQEDYLRGRAHLRKSRI